MTASPFDLFNKKNFVNDQSASDKKRRQRGRQITPAVQKCVLVNRPPSKTDAAQNGSGNKDDMKIPKRQF